MNATFLKCWTTWLLPLIVLRAFIPVGFMLNSGPQGLELAFCPSVAVPAALDGTSHGITHDGDAAVGSEQSPVSHSQQGSHDQHRQNEHAPCPYGLVAAAATAESRCFVVSGVNTDEAFAAPVLPLLIRSPIGAERIRGPPSVSREALI